jgi:hypothetical protein
MQQCSLNSSSVAAARDMPGACGHSAGSQKRTDAYDAIAVQQHTVLRI